MRGPAEDSTLPDPTGPEDEHFVYHLTPAAEQLLAEHARATGTELHRPAARAADVPDAAAREVRRRGRRARTRRARQRGRRFGTISYRRLASGQVPYLRLSGDWLRRAGFDQEQEFEITVGEGRLVIEAV
jgi:hypothetical protein